MMNKSKPLLTPATFLLRLQEPGKDCSKALRDVSVNTEGKSARFVFYQRTHWESKTY